MPTAVARTTSFRREVLPREGLQDAVELEEREEVGDADVVDANRVAGQRERMDARVVDAAPLAPVNPTGRPTETSLTLGLPRYRRRGTAQSSHFKRATRRNSLTFDVTSVAPRRRA